MGEPKKYEVSRATIRRIRRPGKPDIQVSAGPVVVEDVSRGAADRLDAPTLAPDPTAVKILSSLNPRPVRTLSGDEMRQDILDKARGAGNDVDIGSNLDLLTRALAYLGTGSVAQKDLFPVITHQEGAFGSLPEEREPTIAHRYEASRLMKEAERAGDSLALRAMILREIAANPDLEQIRNDPVALRGLDEQLMVASPRMAEPLLREDTADERRYKDLAAKRSQADSWKLGTSDQSQESVKLRQVNYAGSMPDAQPLETRAGKPRLWFRPAFMPRLKQDEAPAQGGGKRELSRIRQPWWHRKGR